MKKLHYLLVFSALFFTIIILLQLFQKKYSYDLSYNNNNYITIFQKNITNISCNQSQTFVGYLGAIVVDYINGTSKTEYYFFDIKENSTYLIVNLYNATLNLKQPLNLYVGNPIKINVKGILIDKETLFVCEIYD
ncbi:MAG: hypothetical protein QW367_01770 [Candidatus Aenigmatarchaeota archaeon]